MQRFRKGASALRPRSRFLTMRLNVWIVLVVLLVVFAITRYMRHQPTPHLCRDDPTASVCER
jgi:hypothetical protein